MIFVTRNDSRGDVLVSFDGMDEKAVSDMYTKDGISFDIVDKVVYDALVAEKQAAPKPKEQADAEIAYSEAIGHLKDKGKTADERIDALVKVMGI